jgi:hypothetical protein
MLKKRYSILEDINFYKYCFIFIKFIAISYNYFNNLLLFYFEFLFLKYLLSSSYIYYYTILSILLLYFHYSFLYTPFLHIQHPIISNSIHSFSPLTNHHQLFITLIIISYHLLFITIKYIIFTHILIQ